MEGGRKSSRPSKESCYRPRQQVLSRFPCHPEALVSTQEASIVSEGAVEVIHTRSVWRAEGCDTRHRRRDGKLYDRQGTLRRTLLGPFEEEIELEVLSRVDDES